MNKSTNLRCYACGENVDLDNFVLVSPGDHVDRVYIVHSGNNGEDCLALTEPGSTTLVKVKRIPNE